jgi:beta-lactamase regulating signal transducer with metallopeptidase domain
MTELGMTLAWCAVQVGLLLIPAALLHSIAARRCPASGSRVGSISLGLVVVLTLSTLLARETRQDQFRAVSERSGIVEAAGVTPTDPTSIPRGTETIRTGAARGWSISGIPGLWKRLEVGAATPAAVCRPWSFVLATFALAGISVGLLRLLFGLWAVRLYRLRGRPVDDPGLLTLLEELRAALRCRRRIELIEAPDLTTPATAGWRRPLILLPDDWRSWDEQERRVVLAHELSHICRGDYAAGIIAQVALALHFYHPLVRWVAHRLQIHQELAADALGAANSGGTEVYLQALSRLALRQDGRVPGWPARAFLPAKGTLIRRIKMLRNDDALPVKTWSRRVRILSGLFLLTLAVGVSALRGPVRGAAALALPANEAPSGPATTSAFDLTYVPEDANGLVAIRPAALFRRQGMAAYSALLNQMLVPVIAKVAKQEGIDLTQAGLVLPPIESIDQITVGVYLTRTEDKKGPPRRVGFSGFMVRTSEPFDWANLLRASKAKLTEVRHKDQVYYTWASDAIGPAPGNGPIVQFPDNRTIVFEERGAFIDRCNRTHGFASAFARGKAWDRVSRGLFAVALDNRDGQLARELKNDEPEVVDISSLFQHAEVWTLGIDDADTIALKAIATCRDAESVAKTARATEALLATLRGLAVEAPVAAVPKERAPAREVVRQLLLNSKLEREEGLVVLRTNCSPTIADLFALAIKPAAP